MPKEFLMPELAESVVEGEIVQWLVAEGENVKADQPLVEVMTDKVTVELPSPYTAKLERHLAKEGDIVPVKQAIALFADTAQGQTAEHNEATEPDDGESLSLFKPDKTKKEEAVFQIRKNGKAKNQNKITGPYGRILAVPAARKLARDLNIDINQITGSGPNGRIRVNDVKAHNTNTPTTTSNQTPEIKRITHKSLETHTHQETRIPLKGLRRAISNQMLASHLHTVRTLHVDEADVSALVTLRTKLKPKAQEKNTKLSYLPFIMKAVVSALKKYPNLNSSLDESNNEIIQKHYYNLGMAVATDAGLVVPVIHNADQKTILDIANDVNTLATKARDNKLTPQDMQNGTFSITNIGSLGGLFSFPIINVPEAAILGVHSIKKRPIVLEDDSIVARQMLYLSLSFDHRVIDGAEAAMFTSYLIKLLETPESLMLEL